MKKLLGLLGAFGLVTAAGVTVVSCGHKKAENVENIKTLAELLSGVTIVDTQSKDDVLKAIKAKLGNANLKSDYVVEFSNKDVATLTKAETITIKALQDFNIGDAIVKANDSFKITVADATKVETVKIADIQAEADKIKGKKNLPEVQTALNDIVALEKFKDKIQSLTGENIDGQPTNVKVTIVLKPNYKLDVKTNTITITGAIQDNTPKIKINAKDISDKITISGFKTIAEVQKQLDKFVTGTPDFPGVIQSLTAKTDPEEKINVIVKIKLNEGYELIGADWFRIIGAIDPNK
ncbi:lipoprotein [Spiroplasma endosymbiont of Crioceris asparagi]|uniref:lipoprotein n=1 Tax=Spiroplasma endosymbiont of Crioceris asparagi TaxID=3066286 RepID=UPI0030CA9D90